MLVLGLDSKSGTNTQDKSSTTIYTQKFLITIAQIDLTPPSPLGKPSYHA